MTPTTLPPIPQCDPGAACREQSAEINRAIQNVLAGGRFILGAEVAGFEQEFAAYNGVAHAVGVGSGTDALLIALRCCGVEPGDAVLTVSHTAVATATAIRLAGAVPLMVDVDPRYFVMDPNRVEDALRQMASGAGPLGHKRLKALIPVHLYGQCADMPAIMGLARQYGLRVIEDCAQAHGAEVSGRKAGTWGDFGAFSFYPTKNLAALGDGGALITDQAGLAEQARLEREYGWRQRYVSERVGMNSRLDELQAAILRVRLPTLDANNRRRGRIAVAYNQALTDTPLSPPRIALGCTHVFHQYVVLSPWREALQAHLREDGIATLVHYPVPVHLQPAYRDAVIQAAGGLKHTERIAKEVLSLPMFPQLEDGQVQRVGANLRAWALSGSA